MGFILTECISNLCETEDAPATTGFVLIRLRSCSDADSVVYGPDGTAHPVALSDDIEDDPGQVYRFDIDPITGCWESCVLPCNTELAPAGTYYEVVRVLNGVMCGPSVFIQTPCDCEGEDTPTYTVKDVSVNRPNKSNSCTSGECNMSNAAIIAVGSNCLTLGVTPGDNCSPATITGSIDISGAADNMLVCANDGLYVAPPETLISDADCNALVATNAGLFVAESGNVDVADSNTVDLGLSGDGSCNNPHVITADVVVSGQGGNTLSALTDGLFVGGVEFEVAGGCGIDASVTGGVGAPFVLNVAAAIDTSTADNMLLCGPNGLRVPGLCIEGTPGGKVIEINISGSGAEGDCYVIGGELNIDPASMAGVTCTDKGLLVDIDLPESPTFVGLGCVTVDDAGDTVSVGLDISGAADNVLVCGPDGLYVPAPAEFPEFPEIPEIPKFIEACGVAVDFDTTQNCLTIGAHISSAPGNALSCTQDGLFVEPAPDPVTLGDEDGDATVVTVVPTATGYDVTVDVVVDPNSPAPISIGPNGLTVDCCALDISVEAGGCLTADVDGDGTADDPMTIELDLVVAPAGGLACGPNGLELVIDPSSPVDVSVGAAGLYVGCCALTITTDGNAVGVNSNADGDEWDITLLSTDAGNLLITGSDGGLWVNCATLASCLGPVTVNGGNTAVSGDNIAGWDIVTLSGDTNNLLSVGSDGGLFVDCAALANCYTLDSLDTNTVNTSISGTPGAWIVSADVIIDPAGSAPVTVGPNGIKIDCCPVADLDCDEVLACLADITVNGDTDAISGDYEDGWDITTISGDSDNILSLGADGGLYFDCDGVAACLADITVNGGTDAISGDYVAGWDVTTLSGDADNVLVLGSDGGLFVDCAALVGCLGTITVNGATDAISGDYVNDWDIITLSTDADNLLVLGSDGGLFIDCDALAGCFVVQVDDTDSVDNEIIGSGAVADPYIITSTVIIDPAAGNALTSGPDGLYACNTERLSFTTEEFCPDVACGPTAPVFGDGLILDGAITSGIAGDGNEIWEVLLNGAVVATATAAAGSTFTAVSGFPIAIATGDVIAVQMAGAAPDSPSQCTTLTLRITESC